MITKQRLTAFLLLLLLTPVALVACGMGEVSSDGYENTSLEHAHTHWAQGDKSQIPFLFVDVRTAKEFKGGHIPGAINIPVQQLPLRMQQVPSDQQVYVYCEAGIRSARAASMLVKAGYSNIENIGDGMRGWRKAGYQQEK